MWGGPRRAERFRRVPDRWWPWVGTWTAVGLAIRVGSVLGRPNRVAGGDTYYYHHEANLLVAGKGFINPFVYLSTNPHHVVQSAAFPPGFVFVLALAAVVGFKSFFAQRIWCCIIGAAAVTVGALAGREIAGRRVGLIAAFLLAVYPNIWMSDEIGMSETLSPLLVAVVLLTAYRFWKTPDRRSAAWLGLSIGAAALARDELSLLGLFLFVPLVLLLRGMSVRRRAGLILVGAFSASVLVAPWIGYNMSRFKDPVFISSGLGVTLASTDCGQVFNGPFEGYWSFSCAASTPIDRHADESVQGAEAERHALDYVESHENRLIPVLFARLGRGFGLFHPMQQIHLDAMIETRPYHWALVGLGMYYGLAVLSVGGVIVLRRRRVPVLPLMAIGMTVVVSMAIAFGDTRYRSTFEVSLVILGSVAIDRIWSRVRPSPAVGTRDAAGTIAGREPAHAATGPGSLMPR